MTMNAEHIELEIYRSGLKRKTMPAHHLTQACKGLVRHARRFDRARLQLCNGIERWDQQLQRMIPQLTEDDQERLDKTIDDTESAMRKILKDCLTPGTILDFRYDPRTAILRFVDKENRRDGWIE